MRALQAASATPLRLAQSAQQRRRLAPPRAPKQHRRQQHVAAVRAMPQSRDEAEGSLTWRYEWDDEGAVLAAKLRAAFLANVSRGEGGMDVAEAALLIAAEDDALMSVTGVPLPVEPYLQRIAAMADELTPLLPPASSSSPDVVIAAVESYLWEWQRFRPPNAPAIGAGVRVDHPGVYEDARHAYLSALLTRKVGSPAVLAVLYAALWRLLLARGAVAFSVRVQLPRSAVERPTAVPLTQGPLATAARFVNFWPAVDALSDMLRQLKRSYWPFAWNTALDSEEDGPCGSGGGFLSAARAVLNASEDDAATTAIARTAAHRLARGVWTSSGAGDIRRARAAAERLVALLGDAAPRERRDLGVLLLHCAEFAAARRELSAFAASPAAPLATPPERAALDALLAALPLWEAEAAAAGPPPPRRKSLPW